MIFLINLQVSHSFSVLLLSLLCLFVFFLSFALKFICNLGVFQVYSREGEMYQYLSFFFFYLFIYLFIYLSIFDLSHIFIFFLFKVENVQKCLEFQWNSG